MSGPICLTARLTGFFFFSSRRRHTRSLRDWSSDVCSSDLLKSSPCLIFWGVSVRVRSVSLKIVWASLRSEERRVGKECRSRWSPYQEKKKRRQHGNQQRQHRHPLAVPIARSIIDGASRQHT